MHGCRRCVRRGLAIPNLGCPASRGGATLICARLKRLAIRLSKCLQLNTRELKAAQNIQTPLPRING